LLTQDGDIVVAPVNVEHGSIAATIRDQKLLDAAQQQAGPVVSQLSRGEEGAHGHLIFLTPVNVEGRLSGYAGTAIDPRRTSLLKLLGIERTVGTYEVVDGGGHVVASTWSEGLMRAADHDEVLTQAIRERRDLRGRCHTCHTPAGEQPARRVDILAFASLPSISLGVTVRQPEAEALAPAFDMRNHLVVSSIAFALGFLAFAWLAVRGVAGPLAHLIAAVREAEGSDPTKPLPSFPNNEVGQLANSLQQWRGRVARALIDIEEHRNALRNEVESSNRLLGALQQITEYSLRADDATVIVENGLERLLATQRFPSGTLGLRYREQTFSASIGIAGSVEPLQEAGRALLNVQSTQVGPGTGDRYRTHLADPSLFPELGFDPELKSVLAADLDVPWGLSLICVLVSPFHEEEIEDERLHSLLHHIVIAAANRLLQDERAHRHQLRRELLGRVLSAQEEERRRVARELHDSVSQDLAAMRLQLERLANQQEKPEAVEQSRMLERQVQTLLGTVRRITLDLRPLVLDKLGFIPALQWHIERLGRESSMRGQLVLDGEERELGRTVSVSLFRIFQECINNIVQHSEAAHVFVTIDYQATTVALTVEDDGKGFVRDEVAGPLRDGGARGLGLLGIEERARLLGGEVVIESAPGEGTTVHVTLPAQSAVQEVEGRAS
jgi:signal transduction histidine kinase